MKSATVVAMDRPGIFAVLWRETREKDGRNRETSMRKLALLLALMLAGATTAAHAQDYPTRPIRLIVPFAAGGAADATARILGKKVGDALGQTFVIENRGGGNGGIGTEIVKSADPDGYTLLLGQSGPISINPGIYPKLAYDPEKDLAPICMTTAYPYILVVNPSLGVKTLAELVALAKRKPDGLQNGRTGVGDDSTVGPELCAGRA